MSHLVILFLAMLLDAAVGEPRWMWERVPHPAQLIGRAIEWKEAQLNTGDGRRLKGVLALAGLALGAVIAGIVLSWLGWIAQLLIAAVLISQRALVDHVAAVGDALRLSVGDGRLMVARIVGRDTSAMDGPAVARAAIESAAENLSDSVIAPVFWFVVAGLPGLVLYKAVNTADSMIGYRNDRYAEFGWASARCDDLLNWIPARLTAGIIAVTHGQIRALGEIAEDARLHRSPNAGWPEAAMARALGVALSGPRSYDGELRDYPYVNEDGTKALGPAHVDAACAALWRSWAATLAGVLLLALASG
ncbi:adenosylcobinamide-phosphate synthase CbiB [Roseovarius salinarum]|uniref:adenosylcobinamide-phosphate synthase CbiB n=1 Tax=Roseovarius salinarum TaxID=1981892 RepID=UPI000C34585F|nr:adenosylcobinamide-phosphate synthase CbiB [Roseovarius salinarum]